MYLILRSKGKSKFFEEAFDKLEGENIFNRYNSYLFYLYD